MNADCLKVVDGGKIIADHRICPYRHQFIKDASHFQGIVRRRRGALEDYRRQFQRYGEAGINFINGGIEDCHPNLYYHWRKILDLSEGYPEEAVKTALNHCLDYRAFSFSVFRNVLGKLQIRREIDPSMVTVCGRCREDLPAAGGTGIGKVD